MMKKDIRKTLKKTIFGKNVIYSRVCDSTNELAKRKLDMPHGTVFIANKQTNGKGRLGRTWESQKNSGIYMSMLLKEPLPADAFSQITLVAGVAVCHALGYNTKIKWPNDIIIGTRKVCGILTEKTGDAIICGIGINVNTKSFSRDLKSIATSLFIETGEKYDRDYICALVLYEFELLYDKFKKNGFTEIYEEYANLCATLGKNVIAAKNRETITGVATAITPEGELVIDTGENEIIVSSGEVSVRGIYGYI